MQTFDMILKNGKVITMDNQLSQFEWIAVKDGRISAIGNMDECPIEANQTIDLDGKTVLPGFFDCHMHLLNSGLHAFSINLSRAKNIAEVLKMIEEECISRKDSSWVFGSDYIQQCIEEQRFPNRWELDKVSHGHKILIYSGTMHCCAVNSEGLFYSKVPEHFPGVIKENGEMSGVFASDESALLGSSNILGSLSEEEIWMHMHAAALHACENGVTTINAFVGDLVAEDKDLTVLLANMDKVPINILPFFQTWKPEEAQKLGLPRVGGCLTLDGAIFEHTMAMFEPYTDTPALRGVLYHNDQEVYDFVSSAHRKGLQCTMHAVGERAIDQLLWTYHRVFMEQGIKDLRHRIEHFDLPTYEQITKACEMGIILSMQPGFSYHWDDLTEFLIGKSRVERSDPFQKIIKSGGIICGGSDSPVTDMVPLTYIAHCTNRTDESKRISITDAIKMFTINGAYACRLEDKKGSLEIGKDADLVVIDKNPYENAGKPSLYEMNVELTIVNGKVTYQKM